MPCGAHGDGRFRRLPLVVRDYNNFSNSGGHRGLGVVYNNNNNNRSGLKRK